MDKIIGKVKKLLLKTVPAAVGSAVMAGMSTVNVYATAVTDDQVNQVTLPIKNLLKIFTGVVSAIGAIILLKNIVEAVQAYQQQDSSGMYSALKGCAAGGIMWAAGLVLTIIGIPGVG